MIFDERAHTLLSTLFQPAREYAGYRPDVREAPNGDTKPCPACANGRPRKGPGGAVAGSACPVCDGTGRVPNVDATKRFLHVALKYHPPDWAVEYLARAHWQACRVAEALGVPDAYYPRAENGTLRVLEYPAGAGSVEHTDFNLFTIVLWRDRPKDLELAPLKYVSSRLDDGRKLDPSLHIGEIGELVGLGPATPHRVPARPYPQRSIVYFALPANGARLPGPGLTVSEWLAERIKRSRY